MRVFFVFWVRRGVISRIVQIPYPPPVPAADRPGGTRTGARCAALRHRLRPDQAPTTGRQSDRMTGPDWIDPAHHRQTPTDTGTPSDRPHDPQTAPTGSGDRSTGPDALRRSDDPTGPKNSFYYIFEKNDRSKTVQLMHPKNYQKKMIIFIKKWLTVSEIPVTMST